jgi:hypothetical protein
MKMQKPPTPKEFWGLLTNVYNLRNFQTEDFVKPTRFVLS